MLSCKRSNKLIVTLGVLLTCIVVIYIEYEQVNKLVPFKAEVVKNTFVIPNDVHFILFDKTELEFIQFLSIMSAIKVSLFVYAILIC